MQPSSSLDALSRFSTKHKKARGDGEDDVSWEPEESFRWEMYNARPRKQRSSLGQGQGLSDEDADYVVPRAPPHTDDAPNSSKDKGKLELDSSAKSVQPIPIPSSNPEHQATSIPESEPPKTQKKRGRKKKESKAAASDVSAGADQTLADEFIGQDAAPEPADKPKRKRGRPKKSESTKMGETKAGGAEDRSAMARASGRGEAGPQSMDGVYEDDHPAKGDWGEQLDSPPRDRPSKKAKAAGKQKATKPSKQANDPSSSATESRALSQKSDNAVNPSPKPDGAMQSDETKENLEANAADKGHVAKESVAKESKTDTNKPGATSGQAGKVPIRVGLSKRSRIAPLLKSLRK